MKFKKSLRGAVWVTFGAFAIWTAIIAGSLSWNLYQEDRNTFSLAHKEAIAHFNKDQGFRLWGTKHGGIYVPITDETPPSPYLSHIPERDIETPSGKKLTLMNPAYMVRQLMEDYNQLYGIKGKITGKILLRPENAPDEWEVKALTKLEEGEREVLEVTEIAGEPYLRLMRPMMMTEGCLKCHGHLGFKVGDIRGGVGVAVPIAPYLKTKGERDLTLWLTHLVIWALGMGAIGVGSQGVRNHILEMRQLNAELEKRVESRTADLKYELGERKKAEVALLEAKELAETANLAKSEFLSRMSHELRTPLNGVLGFAQLLEHGEIEPLTESQSIYVNRILHAGDHLLGLIDEILDLSRIETGNMAIKIEPIEYAKIAEECMALVTPLADKHKIKIMNSINKINGNGYIVADTARFRQVLVNLLSNAIKYNRVGGSVDLQCEKSPDHEGYLRFSVTDSGKGIEQGRMQEIFTPFYRVGDDTSGIDGTGIGLTITRMLVELMGGEIGAVSARGEGSCFWFDLPMPTENKTQA